MTVTRRIAMMDQWPDRLVVRPLTTADAEEIARWRYDGPWSTYDSRPDEDPMPTDGDYLAVAGADGGPLVGFCCTDAEARVPGLDGEPGVLDIGLGMDPARVGAGHGLAFGTAVLDHYGYGRLRAVVQSWNERSLRLTRSLGFVETGTHTCVQDGSPVRYTIVEIGAPQSVR
jgi:RimJ/RimL family protein N-acetyltransferase